MKNIIATHNAMALSMIRKETPPKLLRPRNGHHQNTVNWCASSTLSSRSFSSSSSCREARRVVTIYNALDQGCLPYTKSWAWQQVLLYQRLQAKKQQQQQQQESNGHSNNDCILLLEHEPVYTLGRGADESHLTFWQRSNPQEPPVLDGNDHKEEEERIKARWKLARTSRGPGTARLGMDKDCNQLLQQQQQQQYLSNTEILVEQLHRHITDTIHPVMAPNHVPIFRVERGGEVTFHGPSQLVIYPLLDLQQHGVYRQDLHWYLRQMETVVMETLVHFGITGATRDEINTGVWVHEKKVAAIGISASKWITTHGVALNVQPDLSYFDTSIILPCGIEGRQVTSMAELLMASTSNVTSGTVALPTMQEVAIVVAMKFGEVFNVETVVA